MGSATLPSASELLDATVGSLQHFVEVDGFLLELTAHELAMVHRFGVYLEDRLRPVLADHGLSIDCDYDRHHLGPKRLPVGREGAGEARFRPDLILHRRGSDDANLLVVEWKKAGSAAVLNEMRERLGRLVDQRTPGGFGYLLGVLVDSSDSGITWECVGAIASRGRVT